MLTLALLLNIVVLLPVCYGLATSASWASSAFGQFTPARGILLSIYLSILMVSAALLLVGNPAFAAPLLAVQIVYKVTTPFTAGTLRNPVVISNLAIAAFHAVTLWTLWPELAA
jgi:hypothetical protein